MTVDADIAAAHDDLVALVSHGSRFHGTPEIQAASEWLESRLTAAGLTVTRQAVPLPGWTPGDTNTLRVTTPIDREMPVWPMLWSGSSGGPVTGILRPLGPSGIWGDSITWQRFVVMAPVGSADEGTVLAYVHARDVGPAAPQPLPHGSDLSVPHLVVGRIDGLQLQEWAVEEKPVTVTITGTSAPADTATSDNLIVEITGRDASVPSTSSSSVSSSPAAPAETLVICAHYDSFFNTVGAYDNGSGTIALLRLAERWASAPPARSVRLIWFTAEEWHLGGSRHYVDAASPAALESIAYVVNLDGLGRGNFLESFGSPEAFGTLTHDAILTHAAETSRTLETLNRFPPTTGTDDASFYRAGVPSLFLTFNDLHRLHQPDDEPNLGIAANIVWTMGLVESSLLTLPVPPRVGRPGIL